jgi:putative heme-binding domain-containing protein
MTHPFLRVAAFAVAVVLSIVLVGELITRISGEGGRRPQAAAGAVTPEAGEAVFWGKGKCSTCHAVGTRGGAVRGPNQGDLGPLGLPIGARAEARARERAQATGTPYTATEYLVESVVDPGAYVVPGYKNEMPDPTRPPIKLLPDEVRAVVAYLQSLGGTVDPAAIRLPERVLAAGKSPAASEEWRPYLPGDPRKGEALFFDPQGSAGCAKCHRVGDRGGTVGPELTEIAGTRDPRFIVEAILDPSKVIASGYESILVVTRAGRHVTGVVKREDGAGIEIADSQGELRRIPIGDIRERSPQPISLMPGNFREILTVEELHDLLAFLLTLR